MVTENKSFTKSIREYFECMKKYRNGRGVCRVNFAKITNPTTRFRFGIDTNSRLNFTSFLRFKPYTVCLICCSWCGLVVKLSQKFTHTCVRSGKKGYIKRQVKKGMIKYVANTNRPFYQFSCLPNICLLFIRQHRY